MKLSKFRLRFALLLSLLLALAIAFGLTASASSEESYINVLPRASYADASETALADPELAEVRDAMLCDIAEAAYNYKSEVDVSKYKVSKSDFLNYISQLIWDLPEGFSMDSKTGLSCMVSGSGLVTSVRLAYKDSESKFNQLKSAIEEEYERICSYLDDNMTDLEKMLVVHDYMCTHYEYDIERVNSPDAPRSLWTIEGSMVDGIGVCEAYSKAYEYVLTRLGLECIKVASDEINHMWNQVKLGEHWYHVDVTWDDPVYDRCGNLRHKYFLVSDASIESPNFDSSTSEVHTGWKTSGYPYHDCDVNVYESSFWTLCDAPVVFDDVNMYYIIKETGAFTAQNRQSGESTRLFNIDDIWYTDREQGYGTYWRGCYSDLISLGGRIYFNTPGEIKYITHDNFTPQTVFSTDGSLSIFGMYEEDGIIYYALADNPNNYLVPTGTAFYAGKFDITLALPTSLTKVGVGQMIPYEALISSGTYEGTLTWTVKSGDAELFDDGFSIRGSEPITLSASPEGFSNDAAEITVTPTFSYGDANGDGKLSSADAVRLAQFIAGFNVDVSADNDVTGDAALGMGDVVRLVQFLAGWSVNLGIEL